MKIGVGIGSRLLESADGGKSWTEGVRVVPPRTAPRLRGVGEGVRLPVLTTGTLTDVDIASDGVGLAAVSESVQRDGKTTSTTRLLRTRDGGGTWEPLSPDIGWWGRMRTYGSWPPEEIDGVTVLAGGVMAFWWEDPWLFDGPNSHIVYSVDAGDHWRYARQPADGKAPVRIFGPGHAVQRSAARPFRAKDIRVDWTLPPGFWNDTMSVRFAQFTSEDEGYALVVSWPRDQTPPIPPEQRPAPRIGLARTQDGGQRWTVIHAWEGPRSVDLNVRHELSLDVRSS